MMTINRFEHARKASVEYIKTRMAQSANAINDSGMFGKAFEIGVKTALNGKRGNSNKVSGQGKTDVHYKGLKIEIKSNCGELNKITRNDFVVYSMDNETDCIRCENAFVIPANEFFEMIANLGLVREKVNRNGKLVFSIQTYKNSKKKTLALANALADYPTLKEFINAN